MLSLILALSAQAPAPCAGGVCLPKAAPQYVHPVYSVPVSETYFAQRTYAAPQAACAGGPLAAPHACAPQAAVATQAEVRARRVTRLLARPGRVVLRDRASVRVR